MALDAVVFPRDLFDHSLKDLCGYEFTDLLTEFDDDRAKDFGEWGVDLASSLKENGGGLEEVVVVERIIKKRRRRAKSCKNKEELENQRMTHIAVERNRRKLMNEYLSVLRSMMPPGYVYRGDQASIVGGAINFVKELEQLLQTLEAQKRTKQHVNFADSFNFSHCSSDGSNKTTTATAIATTSNSNDSATEATSKQQAAVADVEVNMVESHANLKVLSKRQPKQLLKMVAGLQSLRFTVLHLNAVTAGDQMAVYSFSLKVEDDCPLRSVDEITTAVQRMVAEIEESVCNLNKILCKKLN